MTRALSMRFGRRAGIPARFGGVSTEFHQERTWRRAGGGPVEITIGGTCPRPELGAKSVVPATVANV